MTVAGKDDKRTIKIILAVMLVVVLLFVLKVTQKITIPIALSFFIFVLCLPILNRFDKLRLPKLVSLALVMLIILAIILVAVWFVLFMIQTLAKQIPQYVGNLVEIDHWISSALSGTLGLDPNTSILSLLNIDWQMFQSSSILSASGTIISLASDAMLIFLFVMFLILERQTLIPKLMYAIPNQKGKRVAVLFARVSRQVSRYLVIKAIISAVTGVLFFLASLATGLAFAPLWGVMAFVMNFIPTIGSIIITACTILMAVIQFAPNWAPIIWVAVLTISIQMVLGNIIDPRLQGVQLNLSPFVILVSLSLWSYIWGIMGAFLAVPITSVIQIICANVESLRPIALFIGSGNSYRRQFDEERRQQKLMRKQAGEGSEQSFDSQSEFPFDDGFIMPDQK